MNQRLILPINNARLTASWKTEAYRKAFGFVHYGADLVSAAGDRTLWASGDGVVLAAGTDSVVGILVAVLYRDAVNRITGEAADLVLRYFHLDRVAVKPGDRVGKDTRLGLYGNTGMFSTGAHLHLEADTDTAHPLHSPTVLRSSLLRGRGAGASDRTMTNPAEWLFCKTSPPDNQRWAVSGNAYIRPEDRMLENLA